MADRSTVSPLAMPSRRTTSGTSTSSPSWVMTISPVSIAWLTSASARGQGAGSGLTWVVPSVLSVVLRSASTRSATGSRPGGRSVFGIIGSGHLRGVVNSGLLERDDVGHAEEDPLADAMATRGRPRWRMFRMPAVVVFHRRARSSVVRKVSSPMSPRFLSEGRLPSQQWTVRHANLYCRCVAQKSVQGEPQWSPGFAWQPGDRIHVLEIHGGYSVEPLASAVAVRHEDWPGWRFALRFTAVGAELDDFRMVFDAEADDVVPDGGPPITARLLRQVPLGAIEAAARRAIAEDAAMHVEQLRRPGRPGVDRLERWAETMETIAENFGGSRPGRRGRPDREYAEARCPLRGRPPRRPPDQDHRRTGSSR